MATSSDEAIAKAREFANRMGWFTPSENVREYSRLTPSLWRVQFVGDYQDFEIDVDAETREILNWRCQSPLQIAINKALEQLPKAEQGKLADIVEVIAEEHDRAYQKWTG